MTPTKKATPKLSDLLEDKKPEETQPVDAETENPPPANTESNLDPDPHHGFKKNDESVDDGNPVHTWEEDHDQNLGLVHPDFVNKTPPSELPTTTRVVTEFAYADPSDVDDTGRSVVNESPEE